ncbi:SUMF1/EgtB/PvdO family nonheme iron enzyme [Stieleria marina]|uniref:SUMF1/EgtB/PvdO family nonheme iron enzyme n=1 Tax=Stieleria marina TaxID=1930275 RepID=UPI003AF3E3C1
MNSQEPVVDFAPVQPLLASACVHCHGEKEAEGELRLDTLAGALAGGASGPALVPGNPTDSTLLTSTMLAHDDADIMPPDEPLDPSQIELLRKWVASGAKWDSDKPIKIQPRIDFVKNIQPILEQQCVSCHSGDDPEGGLDLTTREMAFDSGAITAFDAADSSLYTTTVAGKNDDSLMPPKNSGGPLPSSMTKTLRMWIDQGAIWPADLKLEKKAKEVGPQVTVDDIELVAQIHAKILATSKVESEADMADYKSAVPLTKAPFQMVAIKGGTFLMGSPEDEKFRSPIEGPQTKVSVDPFWIGKYEVTWDEYEPFMITEASREKHGARKDYDANVHTIVDGVSQPTPPYTEMSFGMGQLGYPAISMTQHAANKYCQWLSAQTGHFYRLPTEAEWEYACRAGTTTPYSFGNGQLADYAWYSANSKEKYQKIGLKKPNPWGLFDIHGNVREWTADKFTENYFELIQDNPSNPYVKPSKLYPRSARGGGWADEFDQLRSAARVGSDEAWKETDPQLPQSIWYHTDAPWIGFRVIRPLKVPSVEEMYFYWNSASGMRY